MFEASTATAPKTLGYAILTVDNIQVITPGKADDKL
jgi:hypothetical protein